MCTSMGNISLPVLGIFNGSSSMPHMMVTESRNPNDEKQTRTNSRKNSQAIGARLGFYLPISAQIQSENERVRRPHNPQRSNMADTELKSRGGRPSGVARVPRHPTSPSPHQPPVQRGRRIISHSKHGESSARGRRQMSRYHPH
ncbi:Hypothetical protein NTJ_05827 [Nesidiocoris tenuis]|uniref:Uncharacterized protein n=1 Tax=Nesidiocoris tenuis TaxID=355587 RepID=A0ABN7ALV5_9HEMI|nr:Hypothetical protein NTJ_05827 [Nesidiocoris tenuis]